MIMNKQQFDDLMIELGGGLEGDDAETWNEIGEILTYESFIEKYDPKIIIDPNRTPAVMTPEVWEIHNELLNNPPEVCLKPEYVMRKRKEFERLIKKGDSENGELEKDI